MHYEDGFPLNSCFSGVQSRSHIASGPNYSLTPAACLIRLAFFPTVHLLWIFLTTCQTVPS